MHKFMLLRRWLLPVFIVMAMLTTGCGDDEPETEPSQPIENLNPDDSTTDEPKPDEPNPDEPEPEPSNYYTPEQSEFYGLWRVYWEKVEWFRCFNGKWSPYKTEITDNQEELNKEYGWPYNIGFLQDSFGYFCVTWDWKAIADFDNLVNLVEQKGSAKYEYMTLTDGSLSGGDMFRVKWYPEANTDVDMLVFMSGKSVMWRWKITQFDGESFMATPAHYDFDKPEDGAIDIFKSYKFERCNRQN